MSVPDLSEFQAEAELAELRRDLARTQAKLHRTEAKTADLIAAVEQGARAAMVTLGNPPAVPKPKADRRTRKAEEAVLLLSDWHIGKHTVSFNSDVAADRLNLLGQKLELITEIERADHPVKRCHALLNGDLIDNITIYPGHAFEVDSTMFAQVFQAVGCGERLFRHAAAVFEVLEVWESPGNHGRIGKRGDMPLTDNVDLLIYRLIRERLTDLETSGRLVWHPATNWWNLVVSGNYRALQLHGHQIKSFGGNLPAFGIARKVNAWASGVLGVDFTDVYMSHFHTPMVLPLANGAGRTFVNPSIESDNEHAKEFVASTGTPSQRLNFISPDKGRVTSERLLYLDA